MRILQVASSIDPSSGGVAESVEQLSLELIRMGHETELITLDDPGARYVAESPLVVTATGPSLARFGYNSRCRPLLLSYVDSFDVALVHGLWQYHGLAAWRAFRHSDTPYFVFTHGMLDPWFKKTYPLKHVKKWLYWPWADYRLLRDARAVVFTCEEERLRARESFWMYRVREAVTSLGTDIPTADFRASGERFRAEFPQLQDKRIVLFMSRIDKKKGCDLLLDALAQVMHDEPRLRLVMAGPDRTGWVSSLRSKAEGLRIGEAVTWPGMLQGDLKWGALNAAEVFCLPSHQENFGIVIAEALACGKPVLISNKVNIWREVEADGAGCVDDDTADGTVRNLRTWLALDKTEYEQMSRNAEHSFETRFHVRRAAERLVEIIRENTR